MILSNLGAEVHHAIDRLVVLEQRFPTFYEPNVLNWTIRDPKKKKKAIIVIAVIEIMIFIFDLLVWTDLLQYHENEFTINI